MPAAPRAAAAGASAAGQPEAASEPQPRDVAATAPRADMRAVASRHAVIELPPGQAIKKGSEKGSSTKDHARPVARTATRQHRFVAHDVIIVVLLVLSIAVLTVVILSQLKRAGSSHEMPESTTGHGAVTRQPVQERTPAASEEEPADDRAAQGPGDGDTHQSGAVVEAEWQRIEEARQGAERERLEYGQRQAELEQLRLELERRKIELDREWLELELAKEEERAREEAREGAAP